MGEKTRDTKTIVRMERLEIVDRQGNTRVVLSVEQGISYVATYDGRGKILRWLTFLADRITLAFEFFRLIA